MRNKIHEVREEEDLNFSKRRVVEKMYLIVEFVAFAHNTTVTGFYCSCFGY